VIEPNPAGLVELARPIAGQALGLVKNSTQPTMSGGTRIDMGRSS
jgi:hypothetical protein